ncbi:signal recognition particle [Bradyrhizobium huanghuaihaiense]|uniref:signal recognition particle n=1 Tax=Bradyrhizobium huanghuaihaiense TaxID=990078 RepID=UPI0021AA19A5|nr:signal recognition particle [Bradyrhizobium sp. CB3035]UWU80723.1 signal recognition particle [Bradyrhizobium sp. CB3035]
MNLANELGSILASEKVCGLTYDQAAIAAFVEQRVPANDMSFPSTLNMMVTGNAVQIEGLSPSAKTAHCTQVRRVAKSYGFAK